MFSIEDLFTKCANDPQYESEEISNRPLRGHQAEIIRRVEQFVESHQGGVMTIMSSRQTGKNELSAILQRRHLWKKQYSRHKSSWIRTAPTHEPQIVNSKKRLEEMLMLDNKSKINHPLFLGKKLEKSEGYIWRLGNATVEFMSSGPQSNVVGATASECLDMDECQHVLKEVFDEKFAPFTASTNAATLLFGVAANSLDTLEWYRQKNIEDGRHDLNLYYPCDVWAETNANYRAHLASRVSALGWDHPIIKTQYRLIPVANEGTFINSTQARNLFTSEHYRELSPRPYCRYEMLIDLAGGNEDFNPERNFVGESDTATDSTVIWIYEVTDEICQNNIFPVIKIVNCYWWTGVPLPQQEREIKELINFWRAGKVTVDGVGIGRQIAESLEQEFGSYMVKKYIATNTTISEDCFDLLARLNYSAVKMFKNDNSPEWNQFEKQISWTKYSSSQGKMTLQKPFSDKHIDMVKALTYINRNEPNATMHQIYSVEANYE